MNQRTYLLAKEYYLSCRRSSLDGYKQLSSGFLQGRGQQICCIMHGVFLWHRLLSAGDPADTTKQTSPKATGKRQAWRDSSSIKSTLPFPLCNVYPPCHSKFICAKALRQPGLSHTGRCECWTVGKIKIFLLGNGLRDVLRNKTTPRCFQGQNYPFYALFLMCCLDWIRHCFLFVGVIGNEMRRELLLRAAAIPLSLSSRHCHESGYILLVLYFWAVT